MPLLTQRVLDAACESFATGLPEDYDWMVTVNLSKSELSSQRRRARARRARPLRPPGTAAASRDRRAHRPGATDRARSWSGSSTPGCRSSSTTSAPVGRRSASCCGSRRRRSSSIASWSRRCRPLTVTAADACHARGFDFPELAAARASWSAARERYGGDRPHLGVQRAGRPARHGCRGGGHRDTDATRPGPAARLHARPGPPVRTGDAVTTTFISLGARPTPEGWPTPRARGRQRVRPRPADLLTGRRSAGYGLRMCPTAFPEPRHDVSRPGAAVPALPRLLPGRRRGQARRAVGRRSCGPASCPRDGRRSSCSSTSSTWSSVARVGIPRRGRSPSLG